MSVLAATKEYEQRLGWKCSFSGVSSRQMLFGYPALTVPLHQASVPMYYAYVRVLAAFHHSSHLPELLEFLKVGPVLYLWFPRQW